MSEFLAALPFLLAASALVAAVTALAARFRDACRNESLDRREAGRRAAARHPARRQAARGHPGLPVDGKPLSKEELAAFTGIMMRSTTTDQHQERREP